MSNILASVRSNLKFIVSPNERALAPQIELVILSWKPNYIPKKGEIVKDHKVNEIRLELSPDGLRDLIKGLQKTSDESESFERLGSMFNSILEDCTEELDS